MGDHSCKPTARRMKRRHNLVLCMRVGSEPSGLCACVCTHIWPANHCVEREIRSIDTHSLWQNTEDRVSLGRAP